MKLMMLLLATGLNTMCIADDEMLPKFECNPTIQQQKEKKLQEELPQTGANSDLLKFSLKIKPSTKISNIASALNSYYVDHSEYPEFLTLLLDDAISYLSSVGTIIDSGTGSTFYYCNDGKDFVVASVDPNLELKKNLEDILENSSSLMEVEKKLSAIKLNPLVDSTTGVIYFISY